MRGHLHKRVANDECLAINESLSPALQLAPRLPLAFNPMLTPAGQSGEWSHLLPATEHHTEEVGQWDLRPEVIVAPTLSWSIYDNFVARIGIVYSVRSMKQDS